MTKPTVFRLRELADWQRGLAKQAVTPTTREMHQELSVCFDAGADAMDQLTAAQQRVAELEAENARMREQASAAALLASCATAQIPAGSATERIVKENIVVAAVRSLCGMRPDASMSDLLIALRGRFDAHTKNVLDTMDDLNDALRLLGLAGVGAGRSPREVFRDVVLPQIAELQRRAPMPNEIGGELADAHAGLLAQVGDRLRTTAHEKGLVLQPGSILGTIAEVQQEVADIVGWSSVLWARIERLRTAPVWRLPVSEPKQVST